MCTTRSDKLKSGYFTDVLRFSFEDYCIVVTIVVPLSGNVHDNDDRPTPMAWGRNLVGCGLGFRRR